jgi:two-component system osmolarity sensor histidine kinase EnvZ
MIPRRIDSLYLRLLLVQVGLVATSLLVFGALLLIERNQVLAPQFAQIWAPRIEQAARAVTVPAGAQATPGIWRHDRLPPGLKVWVRAMPAITEFDGVLAQSGVAVDDAWFVPEEGRLALWLHVRVAGAPAVWLSGELPRAVLPRWEPRMTVGVALLGLVIALVSNGLAKRVTDPLALLCLRMQDHARSGTPPPAQPAQMVDHGAPPELVAIEQAYLQLAERLMRNERERGLLLAGVSHDLRSPLSRIRLAAEMLPENPGNADGVASITRNVDHADRLTASFLEFVRASTVALNETVDLCAVARSAVAGFDRSPQELRVRAPRSLVLQGAHGLLIERLIVNLVENALKHGGVPVEVAVEMVERGDAALLIVSDTGAGLPPDSAGKLLEAFARGDPSRGAPGFGLGLAIAQQIVVRLRGELSFGRGASRHEVCARLPLQR